MVPQRTVGNDLTGTFRGEVLVQVSGERLGMSLTLALLQTADTLAGVWTNGAGASGVITGIVSGAAIPIFEAKQAIPRSGAYLGSVVVEDDGNRLRGSSTGNTGGKGLRATFSVTRQ